MERRSVFKLAASLAVIGIIGLSLFGVAVLAHARAEQRTPMQGQVVPLLKHAQYMSAAGGNQQLNLSIGLQLRNQSTLDDLLSNIYNPHSPLYHHYLTPKQFAANFGPTADQQRQVTNYLRSQGFTVTSVSSNGLLIDATGNVAQVQSAFQVQINNYQSGSRKFYANASPPTVPSTIAPLILSIGGMDNSVQVHPLIKRTPQPLAGFGPNDLGSAYDATSLHQANVQGSGQTVAVFELDGYQLGDVNQYLQSNNLGRPSISNVLVDGFDGSAGAGAIEVELDIEVIAAMAPQASQIVYEGPNSTQGLNDTYNKIITDDKAQIVSISWGECEAQTGDAELQTLDSLFKQAATEGISMYAASGDSGAYDCGDTNLAVDSPAGDPYIIGVGGTTLQTNNGAYSSEAAWGDPTDTSRSPEGAGGGGGLSNTFALPDWQVGLGVQNQYSNGKREVPDVSADADPNTGYAIYCTVSSAGCPTTGNIVVGGTSAAAPLWAGSTALINEYLQAQGKSTVGFVSPTLYGLANSQQTYAPFHDVTQGNNLFYAATANYDLATGLGSPDIFNIARDIAGGSVSASMPVPTNTPVPAIPTDTPVTPTAVATQPISDYSQ